ncbi:MFS transporter [uncultured Roseibium sp.]|uniref:MFS transporter n=1 Tax=uncultured Roseibium sp. TaxID=1936171 RepID=UPI0026336975|nr:MFS transporter [uncultured Roseibium sp.]
MNATRSEQTSLIDTDWWSVGTVTVGITVFAIAQGLTYPLISLLLSAREVSDTMIGLNAAAFMLGLGTSVLVVPSLTRNLRAGQVIVTGLLGAAILLGGFAATDNLAAWFFLRFALGFCVNAIYVYGEAWLNAATADAVRGRISGVYSAGMATGFVIGPLAIPVFGIEGGLAFAACAVLVSFVAFGLALLSKRARVEPEKPAISDLPRFARSAPMLVFLVVAFGFIDATVLSLSPVYLTGAGASAALAATFLAVMHVGMIVAQPVLGMVLDRMDRWHVAAGCMAATGLIFLVLTIVPIDGWTIWALAALGGSAFLGIYTSALAILGQEHSGKSLTSGAAAFSLAYAAGGVIGPVATGSLVSVLPGATFVPVAIIGLCGAFAVCFKR